MVNQTHFLCLFFSPTREFFTHLETYITIASERLQILTYARHLWPFFSVPHILWHGRFVFNGHLPGPVTLTPNTERLAVELSPPVYNNLQQPEVCRGWDSNTKTFCLRGKHSNPLRHRRGPDTFSDGGLCYTLSFICLWKGYNRGRSS